MARAYNRIAFTQEVRALQARKGSEAIYAPFLAPETPEDAALGPAEAAFITARDGFYQATVNAAGWPYVQFRGGAPGFVHIIDERTLAYADLRGNRQHISAGNLAQESRVALFFMDYPNRRRLKMFGWAAAQDAEEAPELRAALAPATARVERVVTIRVAGFDWNCPAHIPRRFTLEEIETPLLAQQSRIEALEAENARLRRAMGAGGGGGGGRREKPGGGGGGPNPPPPPPPPPPPQKKKTK
ncbi:pyridoxamine 5'-phosphate oxidase family protein, partial [Rhodovulum sp. DZ06]|uniref:pyridoxamine 5'-phosphate oxidase family protein n=1 Tax=Rhodovulum sp. DZ06 TaxID=3425126 RepID=UPI003D357CF8